MRLIICTLHESHVCSPRSAPYGQLDTIKVRSDPAAVPSTKCNVFKTWNGWFSNNPCVGNTYSAQQDNALLHCWCRCATIKVLAVRDELTRQPRRRNKTLRSQTMRINGGTPRKSACRAAYRSCQKVPLFTLNGEESARCISCSFGLHTSTTGLWISGRDRSLANCSVSRNGIDLAYVLLLHTSMFGTKSGSVSICETTPLSGGILLFKTAYAD